MIYYALVLLKIYGLTVTNEIYNNEKKFAWYYINIYGARTCTISCSTHATGLVTVVRP